LREWTMAWPKALNPSGVIEELKRKIGSLREQWHGTRHWEPAHPFYSLRSVILTLESKRREPVG